MQHTHKTLNLFDQEPQPTNTSKSPFAVPVFRVELVQERPFEAPTVTGPKDVAELVAEYLAGADREHFVVVLLATNGKVIGLHTAHIGSINSSIASARDVFKVALLANAASIVVAHNHPSGSLTASREDIRVSKRLVEAGKLMEIPVQDSLIIGLGGAYVSLAEQGLLRS